VQQILKKKELKLNKNFDMALTKLVSSRFPSAMSDWHTIFMNFYREFDRNEDMTFEKDEMTQCFEAFANEDMIGKEFMKLVLEKAGVDNIATGLMALFKEGQYANSVFPPSIYEVLFEQLAGKEKFVKFEVSSFG